MSESMNTENLDQLSQLFRSTNATIVSDSNRFIAQGNVSEFESKLKELGVEDGDKDGDSVKLKLKDYIGCSLFVFRAWNFFEAKHANDDFVILAVNGDYCYYNYQKDKLSFAENSTSEFEIECANLLIYYKLYNFLKSEKFANHHNSVNNEIVLYSSVNGIFKIKYDKIPGFSNTIDYSHDVSLLLDNLQAIQQRQFFKNAFFAFSQDTITIKLDTIIQNAKSISDLAIRNFDIVSKQFNFETFRDSLYKEKEKYFAGIREVVNKIFSQAAGVPISIGATVFATYKVEGDPLFLTLILITFLVYVVYYIRIQVYYNKEINELKSDFVRDFEVIKSKSGLDEDAIAAEKSKILKKISAAKSIIVTLICMISVLGMLAIVYISCQLFAIKLTLWSVLSYALLSIKYMV